MSKKNYREWLGANIQTVSTRDGTKIAIDDLFEKNDVIGLYFGASWVWNTHIPSNTDVAMCLHNVWPMRQVPVNPQSGLCTAAGGRAKL
eukprot:m.32850 g.32850  ORF g.32850 m.32850 type:complete len:89 (+) comp9554_c0_seq2:346-612(+)